MVRWSAQSYTGWLYIIGWPVAGGGLEPGILHVSTTDGERLVVHGTVAFRRTVRVQALALNDWLGVERPRAETQGRKPR